MMKYTLISFLVFTHISVSAADQNAVEIYQWITQLGGQWKLAPNQEGKATQHKVVKPLLGTNETAMSFKTLGAGTTVQEDLLSSTAKHMATMYHCEDKACSQVRATHYCAKQNQPRLLANLTERSLNKITFDCDMTTDLCQSKDDHVHKITHELLEGGSHLKTTYTSWKNGKYKGDSIYHFVKK